MSRSFKHQPFMSICGGGSAKRDKRIAARGVRSAHRQAIRTCTDFTNFLLPDIYECTGNEVYGWSRDGNQMYQGLDGHDWAFHHWAVFSGYAPWPNAEWPPAWYSQMMRK